MRQVEPLSDVELIEQALAFANSGDESAYLRLLILAHGPDVPEPRTPQELKERERAMLREKLAALAANTATSAERESWRRRADGLVLVPSHQSDGSRRHRYIHFEEFLEPPQPQHALVLWLLGTAYADKLCQCRYRECLNFFLRPDKKGQLGGAPTTRFCPGTNHGELEHKADGARRMRELRAERAKPKSRKRVK